MEKKRLVVELRISSEKAPYRVHTPDELWSAIVDDIVIKYGSGIMITVDRRMEDCPEPKRKEIRYFTIEEIRAKIEYALEKGIGRVRCTCGRDLKASQLMYYAHKDGIPIIRIGPQWIYLHCRHCGYDWALWKLGYGIDAGREKVPA